MKLQWSMSTQTPYCCKQNVCDLVSVKSTCCYRYLMCIKKKSQHVDHESYWLLISKIVCRNCLLLQLFIEVITSELYLKVHTVINTALLLHKHILMSSYVCRGWATQCSISYVDMFLNTSITIDDVFWEAVGTHIYKSTIWKVVVYNINQCLLQPWKEDKNTVHKEVVKFKPSKGLWTTCLMITYPYYKNVGV